MAFCSNCGKELPDGTKFCPNCGTQVGAPEVQPSGNQQPTNIQMQPSGNQQPINSQMQPTPEPPTSTLDKFGKLYGILLLVLAIIDFNSDPAIVTILFSAAIIVGAFFCLKKKYKLKGFTIIALILAVICLMCGFGQAKKLGLFTMPSDDDYAKKTTEQEASPRPEERTVAEAETKTTKETKPEVKENTTEQKADAQAEQKADIQNEPKEEKPADEPEKKEISGGVDPDLKAFLDNYEDFTDEYVDFMKKYQADPTNAISMLAEYADMMQEYADFAEKLDKYDSENMSTEDYKYYIEVTTRCATKMLEAY